MTSSPLHGVRRPTEYIALVRPIWHTTRYGTPTCMSIPGRSRRPRGKVPKTLPRKVKSCLCVAKCH
eukprot:3185498-Prymnesium_polylepis.1